MWIELLKLLRNIPVSIVPKISHIVLSNLTLVACEESMPYTPINLLVAQEALINLKIKVAIFTSLISWLYILIIWACPPFYQFIFWVSRYLSFNKPLIFSVRTIIFFLGSYWLEECTKILPWAIVSWLWIVLLLWLGTYEFELASWWLTTFLTLKQTSGWPVKVFENQIAHVSSTEMPWRVWYLFHWFYRSIAFRSFRIFSASLSRGSHNREFDFDSWFLYIWRSLVVLSIT